jgi:hypothetical protein
MYSVQVTLSRRTSSARLWLGAVAVCLALVQASVAIVSAAACGCEARRAAKAASEDCCPAGSHPPGMCPLHRDATGHPNAKKTAGAALAVCNAGAAMQLVLLSGAPPLSKPALIPTLEPAPATLVVADDALIDLNLVPHAPPPKA